MYTYILCYCSNIYCDLLRLSCRFVADVATAVGLVVAAVVVGDAGVVGESVDVGVVVAAGVVVGRYGGGPACRSVVCSRRAGWRRRVAEGSPAP